MQSNSLITNSSLQPVENQRFEVRLEFRAGEPEVVIRQFTWTDGLGWCVQKTVRVPADHLEELNGSLTLARHQIARRKSEVGEFKPSKVLQFPRAS
ncbi:MAG TPA: hypothetical protein VMM84_19015 [Pyrinomonadaceae bacterium]|nr:hypothetical protein [Pyrinomonadaceae bacterium]